ncbi:MAG: MFS transporter [Magnetospirillum sp. WYHS-4]
MTPGRLTVTMCGAEVLTMAGAFAFPALLPGFFDGWGLTPTEAGWISGIYFAAYAVAAPVLLSLTDHLDARQVWLAGAAATALSCAGFALLADGFWSALALRTLAGAGLAATYMPGLQVLVDRYRGAQEARAIAFYTASFSLGVALSFLMAGEVGEAIGWRWAFAVAALAGLVAVVWVGMSVGPVTPHPAGGKTHLLDFRPVLRNREAMGYILGYGIHTGELFAVRSWQVALLAFALADGGLPAGWPQPTTVAMLGSLVAMAASIGVNEVAGRFGRRPTIAAAMIGATLCAAAMAMLAQDGYAMVAGLLLLYSFFIQADSAVLTAGVVGVAEAGRRGITLALHAFVGFGCGFLAPLGLGIILDVAGGVGEGTAWRMAFLAVTVIGLLGPLAIFLLRKKG